MASITDSKAQNHEASGRFKARGASLRISSILILLALSVQPSTAQTLASAALDGGVRVTRVADATHALFGGRLWFSLSDQLRFGGGAWALPSPAQNGTLTNSGFQMDFGYGGVGIEWTGLLPEHLALRAMFGAGSGTILDRVTGARVDSETFMLLEPEVAAEFPLTGWLDAVAGAGYRFTFGVGELARVAPGDLKSWILSAGLRIGF